MEFCLSEDWRQMLEEQILPPVLREHDLGDDVIEIGPGPGFTTDILRTRAGHITVVEIDEGLATGLQERLAGTNVDVINRDATDTQLPSNRFSGATSFNMLHHVPTADAQDAIFAELARVLRGGGLLIAQDAVYNEATEAFHEDDTYNPIDPAGLPDRLTAVGFGDIAVDTFEFGWIATAHAL
jgi:SAM-dependent methyltransferase